MKHLFLLLLLIVSIPCSAQWRFIGFGDTTGDNAGNPIYAFGVHDTDIFLSDSIDGVLRHMTTGLHPWVEADTGLDFSQGNVTSFASLGSHLFAGFTFPLDGSNGPSYSSTNDGSRWAEEGIGAPISTNGKYLFGCSTTLVYRSEDSGQSWQPTTCPQAHNFEAIGACIFASSELGFWRSTDSGTSWTKISVPFSLPLSAFAVINSQIFAGGAGVFRSIDSGQNWTSIALSNRTVHALASYKTYLFAGTDSGVFVSLDSGVTWKNHSEGMGAQPKQYPSVTLLAVLDTTLYAAVDAGSNFGFEYGYATARPISEMVAKDSLASVVQTISSSDTIMVYPNPANGTVTILAAGTSILQVSVMDVLGVDVLDLPNLRESEISLDISKLPSGTYFLHIETANGSVLRKVIRE